MAKVILINPHVKGATGINRAVTTAPLGLAYLAAVLEKNRHKVQIIDAFVYGIEAHQITKSFAFSPDLVGISTNIISHKAGVECAACIKGAYPGLPVVFGGPHSSSLAESVLARNPSIDAVVIGEGEYSLLGLVQTLGESRAFSKLPGVAWRDDGRIVCNSRRQLIENLDELPLPAYHLLPSLDKYKTRSRGHPSGYIITSRGCSYQCSFCNRNIFGNAWRAHSVDRIMEEIGLLVDRYKIRQLDILDDNFTFDMRRAEEVCERISACGYKLKIDLQNGIRVDRASEGLLLKMRRAGVFRIGFGIESACLQVQKKSNKPIDLERARTLTNAARSLGIVTSGFFMIGLPGETAASLRETMDFALNLNPHFANFSLCMPLPGTQVYEEAKRSGTLLKDVDNGVDAGFFGTELFLKPDSLEPGQVVSYFSYAYRKFYLRPRKLIDILLTIRSLHELRWFLEEAKEMLMLALKKEKL